MGDDRPYEIVADGNPTGVVELPVEWILDDYTYYSYDRPSSAYHRLGDSEVYEIYKAEFDKAYEEGTLFLLPCTRSSPVTDRESHNWSA
jgi:hypothetical protein